MTDALTLSKITAPLLPPTTLHRASLIQKLNEVIDSPVAESFSYKLILLCAPAGYGKTLLLTDFARRTSISCCWYFFDHVDIDAQTFINTILMSIRQRFPHFGKGLDSLLARTMPVLPNLPQPSFSFEELVNALLAAVEAEIAERFAIFFCNYHEISQSKSINALMKRFLEHLPAQCIVVIESRTIPHLEVASLITQRQILSLGRTILRFTPQDIRDLALLQGNTPPSETEAEQIVATFDGWIAGILLGTHLGDIQFLNTLLSSPAHPPLHMVEGSRKELFAYLLTEVFSHDLATYTFLQDAVVLQYMVPSLCNDLLSIHDADERLHYLEQQGLFVIRSGEGLGIIYTCHPLVREVLSDALHRQSPERFALLHQRAAELFHAAGDHNQAIYHALQANAWHLAESIIIAAQEQMLAQGQVEILARWIDDLLSVVTLLHPTVLLARTKIYLLLGEHAHALDTLDATFKAIADRVSSANMDDVPILQAEANLLRSKVLFQKGDYSQAQALCQNVLDTISVDEMSLRAEAYMRLGIGANLLGDFHTGIMSLQQALHLWGRDTKTRQTAELHSALASIYGLIGNFALAEHHLTRALTCWDYLHNAWGSIDNLMRMGLIKHYQGGFIEAEAHFTQALKLSRGPLHFQREEASILVNLGELYQAQGLYDQALTCLDNGLALALQIQDTSLTNYAFRMLAMTYLLMGDISTALLLVAEIDLHMENTGGISYERALRELIYGTILMYEGRFAEAHACLLSIEGTLRQMSLRREQVQLSLRIAACQFALGERAEALRRIEELVTTTWHANLEDFITTELHRLPELEQFIITQQEAAHIRTYLNSKSKVPVEQDTSEGSARIPSAVAVSPRSHRPALRIQALGEPAITLDDVPVTHWHLARAMELVFFLLARGCPVHKEQIFVALWPETGGQIEQTLRTNVYYARKVLGEKAIVYQAGTYELKLTPLYKIVYDVALFQDHYTQAKKALKAENTALARDGLLKTIDLYQGNYVQSFYSDWCISLRDELRQTYLDARHFLAQIAWSQEHIDESLSHWKHMLIVDRCLEEAHAGLMRCYQRQGKRGLALRQYQRCTETLKSELGVEPGPTLQKLYQHLIASSSAR